MMRTKKLQQQVNWHLVEFLSSLISLIIWKTIFTQKIVAVEIYENSIWASFQRIIFFLIVKFKPTFKKKFSEHSFSKKPIAKLVLDIAIYNMWHFSPCNNSASKTPKQLYAAGTSLLPNCVYGTISMFIPQFVYVFILKAHEQLETAASAFPISFPCSLNLSNYHNMLSGVHNP